MPQNSEPNNFKLILIGEDDIDDQEFLKEIFSTIDDTFSIVFAFNGREILNFLEGREDHHMPCLILLDYNMPGSNGVEILNALKANDRYHSIPKVIWSTSKSPSYKTICLESGANEYLVKPSSVSELIETCKYMLSVCIP